MSSLMRSRPWTWVRYSGSLTLLLLNYSHRDSVKDGVRGRKGIILPWEAGVVQNECPITGPTVQIVAPMGKVPHSTISKDTQELLPRLCRLLHRGTVYRRLG